MDGEISAASMAILILLIFILAIFGVVFFIGGSMDRSVINNCKEQGWYNFGQTRIICTVEPKKEAK